MSQSSSLSMVHRWRSHRQAGDAPKGGADNSGRRSPLVFLLSFIVLALLMGSAVYFSVREGVYNGARNKVEAITRLQATQIENWLATRSESMALAFDNPLFNAEMRAGLQGAELQSAQRQQLQAYLQRIAVVYKYQDVSLRHLPDGSLLMSSSGQADQPDDRERLLRWWQQEGALSEGGRGIWDEPSDKTIRFAQTLNDSSGKPGAVVVDVTLSLDGYFFENLLHWPGASPSGEILLARRGSQGLRYLNTPIHAEGEAPTSGDDPILSALGSVPIGGSTLHSLDYRGESVLAYAMSIPGTPWVLVAKIDTAEVYGNLNQLTFLVLLSLVCMGFLIRWWMLARGRYLELLYEQMLERQKMEQALRESEERFHQAFTHAPIANAIVGLDGRFMAVNGACCKLWEYGESELLGTTVEALLQGEEGNPSSWQTWLASDCQEAEFVALKGQRKDGQSLDLDINRMLIRDARGQAMYAILQIQDVTEVNRAARRIHRLSQLRSAISLTNQAIIRSRSPAEVYEAVCQACVQHGGLHLVWVGVADGESGMLEPVEVAGPASGYLEGVMISTDPNASAGQGPTAIAFRERRVYICNDLAAEQAHESWQRRAASYGLFSMIALPLLHGGVGYGTLSAYGPSMDFFDDESVGMLKEMADNISFALDQFEKAEQRMQAEATLSRYAREVDDLYQNAPCGYHSVDAHGHVLRINNTELNWLGYQRDEVVGTLKIQDMLDEASRGVFAEVFEQFKRKGSLSNLEMVMRRKDGSTLPVVVNATGVYDADGRFLASRTTVLDITERKRQEALQAEQAERFEQLSHRVVRIQEDERRRLARELHDQVNPNLAALKLMLGTLADSQSGDVAHPLQILDGLEDARALLDDTTAGIREICANLRPTLLDYSGLVPTLESYAQMFSRRTGVKVMVRVPDEEVRLDLDVESMLFRIAQEALTNCAKHAFAKQVEIEFVCSHDWSTLSIRDDGFGFDLDALGREGKATGLGMVTMRERAEFIGGQFSVRSNPMHGTEIRVELEGQGRAGLRGPQHEVLEERRQHPRF